MEAALELSTARVMVLPGMQWRLAQRGIDMLRRLTTRRELLTLGDHSDLRAYVMSETIHPVSPTDEILGRFQEEEFLEYICRSSGIALIVPHPKHFVVDYYGPQEILALKKKVESMDAPVPFFVEAVTGYDPFPRVFFRYENHYPTVGGSDAHEIRGFLGVSSMLSVTTRFPCDKQLMQLWERAKSEGDSELFRETVRRLFARLKGENQNIVIDKHYSRSALQLVGMVPRWFRRRLHRFPANLFK